MDTYHKFVKQAPTNIDFDYPRGSVVEGEMFDILAGDSPEQVPISFGRSLKDIMEFSVYGQDGSVLQSRLVDREDEYILKKYEFVDYNGEHRIGTINVFDRNYQTTNDGSVIISPTHELKELGYIDGTHKIGISFRNNIIGSEDSSAKLMITDISPSRTELKIVPTGLKTTKKPLEVALNFEYQNFIDKQILLSSIYNETPYFIKTEGIEAFILRVIADNEIQGYRDLVYNTVETFKMESQQDFVLDCKQYYDDVNELFFNTLLWKYNETFGESDFLNEYVLCVDRILNTSKRFSLLGANESLIIPHDLYRKTLIAQLDVDRIGKIYTAKFTSYFSNLLNFGNGFYVPAINIIRGNENTSDTKRHTPIIVKLHNPLSNSVKVGNKLSISNVSYSDDIIQTTVLYKTTKPKLYNMRGPNIANVSVGGSSQYTLEKLKSSKQEINRNTILDSSEELTEEIKGRLDAVESEWRNELYGEPIEVGDEISRYFNSNIEEKYLNIDYSNFSNFVRYSSARKRLDVFIFKLAKLSEINRNLESVRRSWRTTEYGKFKRLSYDTQMETLRNEKNKILNAFDGYERFLYFEDLVELTTTGEDLQAEIDEITLDMARRGETVEERERIEELRKLLTYVYVSWPRQDFECDAVDDWNPNISDYTYGDAVVYQDCVYLVGENKTPNQDSIPSTSTDWILFCRCGECVGKKIPMSSRAYTFLSARTYYRPEPIPSTMEEFAQSPAYSWYSLKAKEADFYDKHNDNSLYNNTPEFITRDDENKDYFDFLNFIGHQFDLIHLYVEGIGSIKKPLNNPDKGIPNEMVSHMLDYFGGNFSGYDEGEINALVTQVKTQDHLDYIKKFKERKSTIWRRILNNLPQMLKAIGTEKSIRILFRCYGIPDYLFRVREFGGVEYNTDLNDEVIYGFDTFDYYLNISRENQYIEIDYGNENYDINSIEIRFGFDEQLTDPFKESVIISSLNKWEFGYEPDENNYNELVGRFYFKIKGENNEHKKVYLTDVDTTNQLIHPFSNLKYDLLIKRQTGDGSTDLRGIQVLLKRAEDADIVYNSYAEISTNEVYFNNFYDKKIRSQLIIGNYISSNFFGRLDRIRIYSNQVDERRFENHILFNQSYDTDNPHELANDLIFKSNFDYPYDLTQSEDYVHGIIQNTSFRSDTPQIARCYNFTKTTYPYDFSGEPIRHFSKLPSYGAQVFNNNKVRIETQELITQLSVSDRSTLKSNDRLTSDTNTVGVYFGGSDLINHEIIRFFGNFRLGDYIGDPEDLHKNVYSEFESLRHEFFKHGFGKLNFSTYLNIIESYVDPSLFDNLKKMVPARSRLISGLVVEPTLLERPKIKRRPIQNELFKINDIKFDLAIKNKDFVSGGNKRNYLNLNNEASITGYLFSTKAKTTNGSWYPTEINMNSIKDIPNELMYSVDSYRGLSSGFKIETLPKKYHRFLRKDDHGTTYKAVKINGKIVSGSFFDAYFFGDLGGGLAGSPSNVTAYIHRDTTINGEHPYISGRYNASGYAKFSYTFNGHRVVGKIYGEFNGQIQQGLVRKLRVLGKVGGKVYDECDQEYINGSIANDLIKTLNFNSSPNLIPNSTKLKYERVEVISEYDNVNAVKVPQTIIKKVPINIEYNTTYELQNADPSVANVEGTYNGELGINVSAIFVPPKIVSYEIKWERGHIEYTEDGNTKFIGNDQLLCIKKSSYDYISNILKKEYEENSIISNDELKLRLKYVSDKNQNRFNEQRNILESLKGNTCNDSDIKKYTNMINQLEVDLKRYELVGDAYHNGYDQTNVYVSVKPPVSLKVGDRVYLQDMNMTYEWCNNVDQHNDFNHEFYIISKLTKNDKTGNIDIQFPHNREDFNKICGGTYASGGSIGKVPETDFDDKSLYNIGKIEKYYEYDIPFEFTQKLRFPRKDANSDGKFDTHLADLHLTIKCKEGEFKTSLLTNQDVVSDIDELHNIELKLENEQKVTTNRELYFGNGIEEYDKIPSTESCEEVYRLTINATLDKLDNTKSNPMIIDNEISHGDYVEIKFRKGSYIWHPTTRGVETITGTIKNISESSGKTMVTIMDEYDKTHTIELNATHVYSVKILDTQKTSNLKKIPFSDKYETTLRGTSAEEQRYYPDKDSIKIPINIKTSTYILVEKPYEFYNIIDIGNPTSNILEGSFPYHKSNYRNVFTNTPKKAGSLQCRRSVSSVNTTINEDSGVPNRTPPITRKRKTAIQNGLGDTFWYLDDEPVTENIICGLRNHNLNQPIPSMCDPVQTTSVTQEEVSEEHDPLLTDSLALHYTFETATSLEIQDLSGNQRNGLPTSIKLRDGGVSRSYRKILELDNNVKTNNDNTEASVKVGGDPFSSNSLTIGFWIRPVGVSADNVGILLNNSSETNQRHGVILNPNGNQYALGYNWSNSVDSFNVDLGANLVHDSWSYVALIIDKSGFVRTFINNYFVSNYDLGVQHEEVTFNQLEVGRFSGMIDDIRIYTEVNDYGDVPLSKQATGFISQMYESTRQPIQADVHNSNFCRMQEFDFKYYLHPDFIIANKMYNENPGSDPISDPEIESKRKYKIKGGVNDGQNRNASTEFMGRLCGDLKEIS